jgi:mycofactocin glycosyltransferase
MFITVIVPFRGPEPFLDACVHSLLTETYPRPCREFLFVDNGGTSSARGTIERHPEIQLLHEAQPGAYAARNTALRFAKGEVIAFTDADCAVTPGWLESIAAAMADRTTKIVLGAYVPARPTFALNTLAAYENEKNRLIFGGQDQHLYYGYTNNMAARSEVFAELGAFARRPRGADALIVRRAIERYGCDAIRYEPRMRVRHLEIATTRDYYRKVFVHSQSISALQKISALRPLTVRERMRAFRGLVGSQRHSLPEAAAGLSLLVGGLLAWQAGRLLRNRSAAN